jgi:protein-disulfide isomerase
LRFVVAALVLTGAVVHRELGPEKVSESRNGQRVVDWDGLRDGASVVVPGNGRTEIVEFTDFQCPFCKRFDTTLVRVAKDFSPHVGLRIVHMPLSQHPHARQAAAAFECAGDVRHAARLSQALYASQDSIGLLPWTTFAERAGVGDTASFVQCLQSGAVGTRLDEHRALVEKHHVTGTPTIVVNGRLYSPVPSDSVLRRVLRESLR